MRKKGIVTSLSRKRSYIFIMPEEDGADPVFCHRSEFPVGSDIYAGLTVEYELRLDDKGQAQSIRLLA